MAVSSNPTGGHFTIGRTIKTSTTHRTFWHICKPTNPDTKANLQKSQNLADTQLKHSTVKITFIQRDILDRLQSFFPTQPNKVYNEKDIISSAQQLIFLTSVVKDIAANFTPSLKVR